MPRKRAERDRIHSLKKAYYHLSTDGWGEGFLFHTESQYAYGMTVTGLLTLLFDVTIYDFALMPNHVHLLLSGSGTDCLAAFDYLRQKLSARLRKDGYPPLPDNYWFKLVAVEDPEQMKNSFIYIDRNAYELQQYIPSGYPWGGRLPPFFGHEQYDIRHACIDLFQTQTGKIDRLPNSHSTPLAVPSPIWPSSVFLCE